MFVSSLVAEWYITTKLKVLVAPGINHSLLSCGSLVRKARSLIIE